MDWSRYPNFTEEEFRCSYTGKCEMDPEFMDRLQALRTELKAPVIVTSGYRDKTHPVEASKPTPGEHAHGKAADVSCFGSLAYKILSLATKHGFTRIGVSQKGAHNKRFLHLGTSQKLPNPTIWSY